MPFKKKHIGAPDEDYDGLFPVPSSAKADGPGSTQPLKSVQMSMNSIKMERTQRIQDSGAEYSAKAKADPSQRASVTMP